LSITRALASPRERVWLTTSVDSYRLKEFFEVSETLAGVTSVLFPFILMMQGVDALSLTTEASDPDNIVLDFHLSTMLPFDTTFRDLDESMGSDDVSNTHLNWFGDWYICIYHD
jgi:hypothetical protein